MIWEKQLANTVFKIGKTGLEKLKSLFLSMENYTQLKIFGNLFLKIFIKTYHKLNVISCNFVIFGAIFMKSLPKCKTNADIGIFFFYKT